MPALLIVFLIIAFEAVAAILIGLLLAPGEENW